MDELKSESRDENISNKQIFDKYREINTDNYYNIPIDTQSDTVKDCPFHGSVLIKDSNSIKYTFTLDSKILHKYIRWLMPLFLGIYFIYRYSTEVDEEKISMEIACGFVG